MGLREKLEELKKKALDKDTQKKVKVEIDKRIREAKDVIQKVEKELKDPENQARVMNSLKDAKAKFRKLESEFKAQKNKAVAYAKENPEKALAAAAAAGALAGLIMGALKRKK